MLNEVTPTMMVFTNFFRDQMDRFGEIDIMVNNIANAISNKGIKSPKRSIWSRKKFVNTIIVGVTSFSTLGIDPSSISITAIFVAGLICKMNAEVHFGIHFTNQTSNKDCCY